MEKNEYVNKTVWEYFIRNNNEAKCKFCGKKIACNASSTSGLHRHLTGGQHKMKRIIELAKQIPQSECKIKTKSLDRFLNTNINESMEHIISKLAAVDGFSINAISRSEFIRNSLRSQGHILPRGPTDIFTLIYKYYENEKQKIITKIKLMESKYEKFSISIDEWTSYKNRRYMNVQLYYENTKSQNLGLIRIDGSCIAEKVKEIVNASIKSFGLCFEKDIVATTSDGANVMIKFGKLSPALQQLCYNHAIHLAVVYYKIM